jgi:hypothetical protein
MPISLALVSLSPATLMVSSSAGVLAEGVALVAGPGGWPAEIQLPRFA